MNTKRILYLGLPPTFPPKGNITYFPLIEIVPHTWALPSPLEMYRAIIFTSKHAAQLFQKVYSLLHYQGVILSIGPATTESILPTQARILQAKEFTQEGVFQLIKAYAVSGPILYPHSDRARLDLAQGIRSLQIPLESIHLYTTRTRSLTHLPNILKYDQIIFTSPSCVKAFFYYYRGPFLDEKFCAIGKITEKVLLQKKRESEHN